MEFGLFHEFQRAPGRSEAETFAQSLELVDAAESWGLDAVWVAELHFGADQSVVAAPLIVATAIAARTRRMKIGTAVQVLPLYHPLRLAEEIATLDHLSGGRIICGIGRSNFAGAYTAYGVSYAEGRERTAEILDILKLAWTQPRFSYHGAHYRFDNIALVPKPLQQPYPPIRVAVANLETVRAVGQHGHPIFVSVRLGALSDLAPLVRCYRAAYAAAGHAGTGEVYLRIPLYVADTEREARSEPEQSIMQSLRRSGERLERPVPSATREAEASRLETARRLKSITYEEALRDKAIVGTPGAVSERLAALREEFDLNGILAELNSGGLIACGHVMKALRLLCKEVMPQFR